MRIIKKSSSATRSKTGSKSSVLVLGGGIAGSATADRLSRGGVEVHLVERNPDIGGRVAEMGCKATDKCMRCNVCVADEIFRSVRKTAASRSRNKTSATIRLHTSTELVRTEENGKGLRLTAVLGGKGRRTKKVDVDSIVVAVGYQPYDPAQNSAYHYGSIPNIITGVEAERQLADENRIFRPSDKAAPGRIAFIQCVGSRSEEVHRRPEDSDYCSTVCCSYALRMAQLIRHQSADAAITVFYMDIQKFGKGFEQFFKQCRDKMRFVRSRPYELTAAPSDSVLVKYTGEGATPGAESRVATKAGVCEEEFDLVVLSVGIRPPSGMSLLADKLGIPTDEQGFLGLKGASAAPDLQRRGIYVVGASESPKDIAGCIAQAEAVSALILSAAGASGKQAGKRAAGVCRDTAVIGGGIAGLQTALALSRLGHGVALIHNGATLGGRGAEAPGLFGHLDADLDEATTLARDFIAGLADAVAKDDRIKVYPQAALKSITGEQGDFSLILNRKEKDVTISAGAIALASGSTCKSVSRGGFSSITDMAGLSEKLRDGDLGSRLVFVLDTACEHGREAWISVLTLAEKLCGSGIQVKIYCGNVRVAATGMEALYRRARAAGTIVVKFEKKPIVSERSGMVTVKSGDAVAGAELSEMFDTAVIVDRQDWSGSEKLIEQIEGLRTGPEGELQYDNIWLMPGLTNRPGVFTAGGARGDTDYRAALTDALAVANEIHALLGGDEIQKHPDAATVDADKCVLCLTCLRVCPHGAITIDSVKEAAFPSPVSCKRCGTCASECPAQAITLPGFTDKEVVREIGVRPKLTIFACENSAIPAAEAEGGKHGKTVNIIKVPCAGEVDPRMILSALEAGAERVLVLGCHPESCKFLSGSSRAERRVKRLADMLTKAGVDGSRVSFHGVAAVQPGKFGEYVKAG